MTNTDVQHLIINRLSNEQYETAVKSDTELWLTPELPASTTNLGPVKVDGTTITAASDGTLTAVAQITVDSALSTTSTNPVQNKIVTTAINGKQATITGAASTITTDNLTIDRAVVSNSNGKVEVSDTTSTELGYVHGVTSAIQTQLDNKLDSSTAASTYLPLAGGTLTGNLIVSRNPGTREALFKLYNESNGQGAQFYQSSGATVISAIGGTNELQLDFTSLKHNKNNTTYNILDTSDKAVANGVASLDANTKVPVAQIPDLSSTYSTVENTVTNVVAGSTADKIDVTKNGSTSTITVNNVANATTATKATQDGDGNVISSTYLKAESDTLGTVLNRGNSATTDINFNNKDWFNAGTRLNTYYYSTSQTPNTQYYWYKITPPASGSKSDRYFICIESDVNYPDRRGTFVLELSCFGSGTSRSVSVSLNCFGITGGTGTSILKCAMDADGNIYIQSNAVWSSYMRFIRFGTENDTKTYEQVGLAAFGTPDGFTPLQTITDTGCIRVKNGALEYNYYTVLPSNYFRGNLIGDVTGNASTATLATTITTQRMTEDSTQVRPLSFLQGPSGSNLNNIVYSEKVHYVGSTETLSTPKIAIGSSDNATMQYNSTTEAIEFVFA